MARAGESLPLDLVCERVPSIAALDKHESRSERFGFVPTFKVLEGLENNGYLVTFAQQAKTRIEGKQDFTRHMIRLRHRDYLSADMAKLDVGASPEIIMCNAHDGTSSFKFMRGAFRFVCTNGLFSGTKADDVSVRHSRDAIENCIEGVYEVMSTADEMMESASNMRSLTVNRDAAIALADSALTLRYPPKEITEGDGVTMRQETESEWRDRVPVKAEQIIQPRRFDDKGDDLWTRFNVIQENLMRGGQRGSTINANGVRRRASTRQVNGIDQNINLNRALWTLSERMAEIIS